MKFKTIATILIGLVFIGGAIFWAWDSTRVRSISGAEIATGLGSGAVIVNNPTQETIPVMFSAAGTRGNFTITSDVAELSGNSSREGSGRTTNNVLTLQVPPGQHEFRVSRGSNVMLSVAGEQPVEVTVNPLNPDETRNTIVVALVAILVVLYLISNSMGHRWLKALRRNGSGDVAEPLPA
jgi:hypothetical protein